MHIISHTTCSCHVNWIRCYKPIYSVVTLWQVDHSSTRSNWQILNCLAIGQQLTTLRVPTDLKKKTFPTSQPNFPNYCDKVYNVAPLNTALAKAQRRAQDRTGWYRTVERLRSSEGPAHDDDDELMMMMMRLFSRTFRALKMKQKIFFRTFKNL